MGNVFLRFPEGRKKSLTLSYDDGVEQDLHLIEIMNKYGLKGTFNINSGLYDHKSSNNTSVKPHRRMSKEKITETFYDTPHEAALHSLTHPFLEQLPDCMVVNEILKDRKNLEKQLGTIVRGIAYPHGTFNDRVVDALRACGIVYARTTKATNDFRIPDDWMRLTVTCHHNSTELQMLSKKFVEDKVSRAPYLFYLWGHSYEFDDNDNWHIIENFLSFIGNRDEVWYASNIEIYEYIEAFKRLVFSVDGKLIKNPTSRKIWLEVSKSSIFISPGEMIKL